MKALAEDIIKVATGACPNEEEILESASLNWSGFALRTYRGKTLRKALRISSAIVDFISVLQQNRMQQTNGD